MFIKNSESGVGTARSQQLLRDEEPCQLTMNPRFLPSAVYWTLLPERIILLRCCDCSNKVAGTPDEQIVLAPLKDARLNAQCADSEVRNAFERTPYVAVLKFHVFIHISKSFNFRCSLERILRYLTKT